MAPLPRQIVTRRRKKGIPLTKPIGQFDWNKKQRKRYHTLTAGFDKRGNPKKGKYTPERPAKPPLGTYDPGLDAQERAAGRGLRYLKEDIARMGFREREDMVTSLGLLDRSKSRSTQDLGLSRDRGMENINLGESRGLEDLGVSRSRGLEDFQLQEQRGNRDLDTQLNTLFRESDILGQRQGQDINAAGVLRGGTSRAAAKKRAENLAFAREPIDTARTDLMGDLQRGRGRLEEDYGTQSGRLTADAQQDRGRLLQDYGIDVQRLGEDYESDRSNIDRTFQRGEQDRFREGQRGIAENLFFGQDIAQQRVYQAMQQKPGIFSLTGEKKDKDKPKQQQQQQRPRRRRQRRRR